MLLNRVNQIKTWGQYRDQSLAAKLLNYFNKLTQSMLPAKIMNFYNKSRMFKISYLVSVMYVGCLAYGENQMHQIIFALRSEIIQKYF